MGEHRPRCLSRVHTNMASIFLAGEQRPRSPSRVNIDLGVPRGWTSAEITNVCCGIDLSLLLFRQSVFLSVLERVVLPEQRLTGLFTLVFATVVTYCARYAAVSSDCSPSCSPLWWPTAHCTQRWVPTAHPHVRYCGAERRAEFRVSAYVWRCISYCSEYK